MPKEKEELNEDELAKLIDTRAQKITEEYFKSRLQGSSLSQVSSPSISQPSAGPALSSGPVDQKPHFLHSYEKYCSDPSCGALNPDFKQPDLFCKDCNMPLGNIPDGFEVKSGEEKEVPSAPSKCWACGSTHAKIVRK